MGSRESRRHANRLSRRSSVFRRRRPPRYTRRTTIRRGLAILAMVAISILIVRAEEHPPCHTTINTVSISSQGRVVAGPVSATVALCEEP